MVSQFDVNVRGVIFMSQAVVPHMKDGGRIINLSSIVARLAMPGSTGEHTKNPTNSTEMSKIVYAASKVAVEAITRVMGVRTIAYPPIVSHLPLPCSLTCPTGRTSLP